MPEFCDKCGGIMAPKQLKTTTTMECRSCGKRRALKDGEKVELKESVEREKEGVVVMDENTDVETLPKTNIDCPECGNNEAHWWMQKTRSADEPPTRFFQCTECDNRWREYD